MRQFKKIDQKKAKWLSLLAVVCLAAGIILWPAASNAKKCSKVQVQAYSFLKQRKYKEAYDELKPYTNICSTLSAIGGGSKSNSTNQLAAFNFDALFASSAYGVGNNRQAYAYATKALYIYNNGLTGSQRSKSTTGPYTLGKILDIIGETDPALQ
ncbi:hypothetical protein COY17_03685 [Candidatus Saccharibacteria bacterium CG_4_10_14_0_2_um_filter_52_9]|nr:MAG: hypothetical protein COY17_03685 [Candidatus Saccharibacteria bacterium CG_4_10_14_0_2_um_filter_52_9]